MKDFLKATGTTKRVRLWVKENRIDLDSDSIALVSELQRLSAKRLSVWIAVVSESGDLLAELEDGNDYLWLRNSIDPQAQSEMLSEVRAIV